MHYYENIIMKISCIIHEKLLWGSVKKERWKSDTWAKNIHLAVLFTYYPQASCQLSIGAMS